jgi:hypothetical protein
MKEFVLINRKFSVKKIKAKTADDVIKNGWFLVFNATFNNMSVISWWSVLLMEGTGENHRSEILYHII